MMTARSKPNYRLVISINIFVPLKFHTLYLTEISYWIKQLISNNNSVATSGNKQPAFSTQYYGAASGTEVAADLLVLYCRVASGYYTGYSSSLNFCTHY